MSKHPHAESMALYAQDAMETDAPWRLWQYKLLEDCTWHEFGATGPYWLSYIEYRRKPRTITINGHEVPEQMREAPRRGAEFFIADPYGDSISLRYEWFSSEVFSRWFARGLCHATREAAEAAKENK